MQKYFAKYRQMSSQWHIYLNGALKDVVGKSAPFKTSLPLTLVTF